MAVGFDPQCPFWMALECFDEVSADQRPAFKFRRISAREYLELEKVWDERDKRTSEVPERLFDLVRIGLLDWRNQHNPETGESIPFEPHRLGEVIDYAEAFEIISRRLSGSRLNGDDRKN